LTNLFVFRIGPYGEELPHLLTGGYSAQVVVPLAVALCERFNRPLQYLLDAAKVHCDAGDGMREMTLSAITLLRKGQLFYNRFGFLPCEYRRKHYCEGNTKMSEMKVKSEQLEDLKKLQDGSQYSLECLADEKLDAHCKSELSTCLTYLSQQCGGGTSTQAGCKAFSHALMVIFKDEYDKAVFYQYYQTRYSGCRRSLPLGNDNPPTPTIEDYVDYEPTVRFDAYAYHLSPPTEASQPVGDGLVPIGPFVPAVPTNHWAHGRPENICKDVLSLAQVLAMGMGGLRSGGGGKAASEVAI